MGTVGLLHAWLSPFSWRDVPPFGPQNGRTAECSFVLSLLARGAVSRSVRRGEPLWEGCRFFESNWFNYFLES